MNGLEAVKSKYNLLKSYFTEQHRRLWAASEAMHIGYGGIKIVSQATGLSTNTIRVGISELKSKNSISIGRKSGGGRKSIAQKNPQLEKDLKELLEPVTHGDPMKPLLWTSKSTRKIAEELVKKGYDITHTTVKTLLAKQGYSLQVNKKDLAEKQHSDRDAQFQHISDMATSFLKEGSPVISVDTKKKELVGNFKNGGQEYTLKKKPTKVNMYDFQKDPLKAVPYGIYDLLNNEGWVNLGISCDTATFAVESIRRWWNNLGKARYPNTKKLMITADGGGSNGSRVRLFKVELQKFSNETGLKISVSHFPPGASKWNKIEHRMFSFISQNWRARPLVDLVTIVNLIAATTTKTGLKIYCELDENNYKKGITVTDEELDNLNITYNETRGKWNYVIAPKK